MRFDVVLEKQKEGGYTAYVPKLPGCISEGETQAEALKNIKEAIGLYWEETRKSRLKELLGSISVTKIEVRAHA